LVAWSHQSERGEAAETGSLSQSASRPGAIRVVASGQAEDEQPQGKYGHCIAQESALCPINLAALAKPDVTHHPRVGQNNLVTQTAVRTGRCIHRFSPLHEQIERTLHCCLKSSRCNILTYISAENSGIRIFMNIHEIFVSFLCEKKAASVVCVAKSVAFVRFFFEQQEGVKASSVHSDSLVTKLLV
jgi:hypothetical protein